MSWKKAREVWRGGKAEEWLFGCWLFDCLEFGRERLGGAGEIRGRGNGDTETEGRNIQSPAYCGTESGTLESGEMWVFGLFSQRSPRSLKEGRAGGLGNREGGGGLGGDLAAGKVGVLDCRAVGIGDGGGAEPGGGAGGAGATGGRIHAMRIRYGVRRIPPNSNY